MTLSSQAAQKDGISVKPYTCIWRVSGSDLFELPAILKIFVVSLSTPKRMST